MSSGITASSHPRGITPAIYLDARDIDDTGDSGKVVAITCRVSGTVFQASAAGNRFAKSNALSAQTILGTAATQNLFAETEIAQEFFGAEWSCTVRVRKTSTANIAPFGIQKTVTSNGGRALYPRAGAGFLNVMRNSNSNLNTNTGVWSDSTNTWQTIGYYFNGSTASRFYRDGAQIGTDSTTSEIVEQGEYISIGSVIPSTAWSNGLIGHIGAIKIYPGVDILTDGFEADDDDYSDVWA